MGRVYYDEKGVPHGLPVGIEDARRYGNRNYIGEPCNFCGKKVYYTKNKTCKHCALLRAGDLYGYLKGTTTFEPSPDGYVSTNDDPLIPNRLVETEHVEAMQGMDDLISVYAPVSIERAIAVNATLWLHPEPCAVAGHYGLRTLKNDCYFCELEREKKRPRKEARRRGDKMYTPVEPCESCGELAERSVYNDACSGCKSSAGSARQAAIVAGKTWYLPDVPCKHCGQIAKKNVHNGQCKGCKSAAPVSVSPRQEAIQAGKTWYIPTAPCKYCSTLSERNVHNGSCKGCRPSKDPTPDEVMMKASPDLIIERDAAKALGMGVYRTGVPCENNHRAFRDVKTNNCLDCIKENTT